MKLLPAFGCALLVGCATSGPDATLEAYEEALADRNWARVHALSDQATRASYGPDDFEAEATRTPEGVDASAARLAATPVGERHVYVLRDGQPVVLIREGDDWRVERGGFELARTDTPEAALATLFRAVEYGRLDLLRLLVPKKHAQALSTDAALAAALDYLRPRVEAARALLVGRSLTPKVDRAEATLNYGSGQSVRFVLEDGRWRILDVE